MDKAFQATLETERKCLQLEKEVEQLKQGTPTKSDNTDRKSSIGAKSIFRMNLELISI